MPKETDEQLQKDVRSIQQISIMPQLLDVVCRTTGMGFAAVARVTENRWITCSVKDDILFGLVPGAELKIETTICNEIRQNHTPVVIDHVAKDDNFCDHHTPMMYGFQSYISFPIFRKNGSFFGTLCAIDPKPAKLNTPEITGIFQMFSDLISFHLQSIETLEESEKSLLKEREERAKILEQKNIELEKINGELESFTYVASHDLQEPLRKIQTFSNLIFEKDFNGLSNDGKMYFTRMDKSVRRMETLIKDLLNYTRVGVQKKAFENVDLTAIVEEIKSDYKENLHHKHVTINTGELCNVYVITFQFYQLLQNLISNSIKFSKDNVDPVIDIYGVIEKGDPGLSDTLLPEKKYCHISFKDNGIGFDPQYSDKIFKVFQRLNGKEEYEGTGIGLSIVKKIVDNHNGFIKATAEENKGATFDIYLPQTQD